MDLIKIVASGLRSGVSEFFSYLMVMFGRRPFGRLAFWRSASKQADICPLRNRIVLFCRWWLVLMVSLFENGLLRYVSKRGGVHKILLITCENRSPICSHKPLFLLYKTLELCSDSCDLRGTSTMSRLLTINNFSIMEFSNTLEYRRNGLLHTPSKFI